MYTFAAAAIIDAIDLQRIVTYFLISCACASLLFVWISKICSLEIITFVIVTICDGVCIFFLNGTKKKLMEKNEKKL